MFFGERTGDSPSPEPGLFLVLYGEKFHPSMAPAESARGKYVKNDKIYNKIDLCRKAQKKKIRRWEKNTDWTAEVVKLLLFDKKLTNRQKFTAENRKIYDPTKKMENVLKKMEKSNKARERESVKSVQIPNANYSELNKRKNEKANFTYFRGESVHKTNMGFVRMWA